MRRNFTFKLTTISIILFLLVYTYVFLISSGLFLEENSRFSFSNLSFFGGGMEYGIISVVESHWSEWLLLFLSGIGFSLLFFGAGRLMALYQKGSHLKSCDVAVTLFKHFLGLWLVTLFLYTVTTYVVFGPTAKLFEGDAFFRLFFFVFVFVPHEADLNGGFFYLFSIFVQLLLFYPFLQKLTLRGNGLFLLFPILLIYSLYLFLKDDFFLSGLRVYTLFLGYLPMFAIGIWSTLDLSKRFRAIVSIIGILFFILTPFYEWSRFLWFLSFSMILFPFLTSNNGSIVYRNLLINIAGSLLALVVIVPFFMFSVSVGRVEGGSLLLYLLLLVLTSFMGLAIVNAGSVLINIKISSINATRFLSRLFCQDAIRHWGREALLMLFILVLIRLSDLFLFYPETSLPSFWGVALLQGFGNDLILWSWWLLFGFFVFRLIFYFSDRVAVAISRIFVLFTSLFALMLSTWYSFSGMESWVLFFGNGQFLWSRLESALTASSGSYIIILFICFGIVMVYSRIKIRIPYRLVSSLLLLSSLILLTGVSFGTSDGVLLTPSGKVFTESRIGNGLLSLFRYNSDKLTILNDKEFLKSSKRFHDLNPTMGWSSDAFPFWRNNESGTGLSSCFSEDSISPHLVFVVCEGLTSDYSGDNALKISLTPFLDSLSSHGINLPRTYSVTLDRQEFISSLFSSLIVPDDGFLMKGATMPDYQSLFSRLGIAGYQSRLFNFGYPMGVELKGYLKKEGVVQHYSESLDSMKMINGVYALNNGLKPGNPLIDLVLIGNDFAKPFGVPVFTRRSDKYIAPPFIAELKDSPDVVYSNTGMDKIISMLIHKFNVNSIFKNTVFVIVGTGKGSQGKAFDLVDKFHVPCVIWSPLIKIPSKIKSVTTTTDIIPTIERLLESNYSIRIPSDNHWMGRVVNCSGIDRSTSITLLQGYTPEECYYMEGERIVDDQQLYQMEQSGIVGAVVDLKVLERMKQGQQDLLSLIRFVRDYNALIPVQSFEKPLYSQTFLSRNVDFERNSPVAYRLHMTSQYRFSGDSAQAIVPGVEFCDILEETELPADIKALSVKIDLMVKVDEAPGGKTPSLVYSISGKDGKSILYKSDQVKLPSGLIPPLKRWVPMSFTLPFDPTILEGFNGGSIKIYFWNTSKATMWYDDLSVSIRKR